MSTLYDPADYEPHKDDAQDIPDTSTVSFTGMEAHFVLLGALAKALLDKRTETPEDICREMKNSIDPNVRCGGRRLEAALARANGQIFSQDSRNNFCAFRSQNPPLAHI